MVFRDLGLGSSGWVLRSEEVLVLIDGEESICEGTGKRNANS